MPQILLMLTFCDRMENLSHNTWVPVTTASRNLRLRCRNGLHYGG